MDKQRISKRCIIFFGPDGSGKTTHSKLLSNFLRKKGYRVCNVRIRANHTISFILIKILQGSGLVNQNVFFEGFDARLARKLAKIWPFIEFASIVPLVILRVYLPLKLGCIVICERYVIDTIVSVAYLFNNLGLTTGFIKRILLGFIPEEATIVYLTAEENLLLSRRIDEPVTHRFVRFQTVMYNSYAKRLNVVSIDTGKNETKRVQEIIKAKLGFGT